jgi:quinoprotein glucose dehydrogenase
LTDTASKSLLKTLALFAAIAGFITGPAIAGDGPQSVDWPAYNGSTTNTHYSSLTQINVGNVSKLKEAWRFDTGEMGGLETSPLIIDGMLYAYTPKQKVIALDAATGAPVWTFDPQTEFPAEKIGSRAERGLSYWRHGSDRRILAGASHYIYAIDAASGKIIRAFGNNGRIDLKENLRGDPKTLSVTITSPGVVYRDLFITGCGTPESLPAPPGDIRAFDVRTGKLRWTFHTIPHPGEFGYDTWPKDAWLHSGAANNWTGMALDQARGIVYVPTGSAATDWYGADRIGDNLFANSLIALDAATGKRLWHFQGVRHDLWDRDFPSPPSLVTVRRGGKDVPAIVQTSKQGFVFVFNRVTGEPLFPIEYRKVPASDVPGEVAATTQPFPTLPAPLSRQMLTEDDMTHRTPEAHRWAVEQFRKFNYTGQFTPNKVGVDTLMFPGWNGGGEWGGVGFDPKTHVAYINATDFGLTESLFKNTGGGGGRVAYMRQCSACHGQDRTGAPPLIPPLVDIGKRLDASQIAAVLQSGRGRMPPFPNLDAAASKALIQYLLNNGAEAEAASAPDAPAQYDTTGYHAFLDPQGYPATSTPWGTLNAINLDTGEYLWKIPFGQYPDLVAQGMPDTGSENFGGPVITAGGVLFIGATTIDKKFRAFEMKTGKLLWETLLPYSATATPATYVVKGRQYVVIAAGGQRDPATPPGGVYVAYALPQ